MIKHSYVLIISGNPGVLLKVGRTHKHSPPMSAKLQKAPYMPKDKSLPYVELIFADNTPFKQKLK